MSPMEPKTPVSAEELAAEAAKANPGMNVGEVVEADLSSYENKEKAELVEILYQRDAEITALEMRLSQGDRLPVVIRNALLALECRNCVGEVHERVDPVTGRKETWWSGQQLNSQEAPCDRCLPLREILADEMPEIRLEEKR